MLGHFDIENFIKLLLDSWSGIYFHACRSEYIGDIDSWWFCILWIHMILLWSATYLVYLSFQSGGWSLLLVCFPCLYFCMLWELDSMTVEYLSYWKSVKYSHPKPSSCKSENIACIYVEKHLHILTSESFNCCSIVTCHLNSYLWFYWQTVVKWLAGLNRSS